jgi:hypothetical protein
MLLSFQRHKLMARHDLYQEQVVGYYFSKPRVSRISKSIHHSQARSALYCFPSGRVFQAYTSLLYSPQYTWLLSAEKIVFSRRQSPTIDAGRIHPCPFKPLNCVRLMLLLVEPTGQHAKMLSENIAGEC